jgi:hypothetical protein
MLYWEHSAGRFDFIQANRAVWRSLGPVWSPTPRMLAELDACVEAIGWEDDPDAVPELKLWLLYVCTLAEQVIVHLTQMQSGWLGRHNKAFVCHARSLGLETWAEVVPTLSGYAFQHDVSDISESWFGACVRDMQTSANDQCPRPDLNSYRETAETGSMESMQDD